MANGYMDIMKWKKIASEAKKADKYLDKVKYWEDTDPDYNDDVYVSDAWEWGCSWIDSWYDAVEVNGLYELKGGKKVHILWKSPKVSVNDNNIYGPDEIMNGLSDWGFDDRRFIQIDFNSDSNNLHSSCLEWVVVAMIDGVKKIIIPHKKGYYIPTNDAWYEWLSIADNETIELGGEVDFDGPKVMDNSTFEYDNGHEVKDWESLSYFDCQERDYNGYNLIWANMRRIA